MLSGGAAFALLGLATAAWFVMRATGVGPAATLVAAGVLEERDRVLVAQFGTVSGDTVLAEIATEALRVDLAQSPVLSLVEPRTVVSALARMELPSDTRVDRRVATELAVREGIKAVVAGELNAAGGGYVLTAEVIASATDESLVSHRVTASGEEDLLDAIDDLSRKLRESIGESLRSTRADPPLQRATTSSLEALRPFSQATRAIDVEGENERGIALLEQALEADSNFAMAWRKLGTQQMNTFYPVSVWGPALTKAFELRDRLGDRERYLATASYYGYLTRDDDRALTAYESMLELDPDDYYALNNASLALGRMDQFELAEEYALRAIDIDPDLRFPYAMAIGAQVSQGKFDAAQSTHDLLTSNLPGIPSIDIWGGQLAFAQGDYGLAHDLFVADLERRRGTPTVRAARSFQLALVDAVQGHVDEAKLRHADAAAANDERRIPAAALFAAISVARLELDLLGESAPALRGVEEALSSKPLAEMNIVDRPYFALIAVLADAGQPDRAQELLSEYEQVIPPELFDEDEARRTSGRIAVARGRFGDGIAEFLRAEDGRCTGRCPELARAYDAAGQRDSALAVMERWVTTPRFVGMTQDASNRGPFYERLGQLYDDRGDLENAAKYYAAFIELWTDADAVLQPRVQAAQTRLQEILSEDR